MQESKQQLVHSKDSVHHREIQWGVCCSSTNQNRDERDREVATGWAQWGGRMSINELKCEGRKKLDCRTQQRGEGPLHLGRDELIAIPLLMLTQETILPGMTSTRDIPCRWASECVGVWVCMRTRRNGGVICFKVQRFEGWWRDWSRIEIHSCRNEIIDHQSKA